MLKLHDNIGFHFVHVINVSNAMQAIKSISVLLSSQIGIINTGSNALIRGDTIGFSYTLRSRVGFCVSFMSNCNLNSSIRDGVLAIA